MTLADFSTEFRKHHRLILWGGLVVVLYLAFLKGSGVMSHIYELRAAVDQNKVLADAKAEKAAADQQAADAAQYRVWKTQSDLQVAALQSQLSSIQVALKSQQAKDSVLAAPELAGRLNVLTGIPDGYKSTPDGLTATLVAGQTTASMLDEVQAATSTIKDQDAIIVQKDTDLNKRQGLLNDANVNLAACQTTLEGEKKAHSDDVKKLKVQGFKARLKWFGLGYVAGLVTKAFI